MTPPPVSALLGVLFLLFYFILFFVCLCICFISRVPVLVYIHLRTWKDAWKRLLPAMSGVKLKSDRMG